MTTATEIAFNINDSVRVKVTPDGERILDSYYAQFPPSIGNPVRDDWRKTDADGYVVRQLWHVMEIFGAHMHIGFGTPIETMIYIRA